jgi:ankyrin repeat protein
MLISHQSDVNAVDHNGLTPLHLTWLSPESDRMINLLIQHGAYLNAQNRKGKTPVTLEAEQVF